MLFNCKKYHQNKNFILNLIQNATPDEETIAASDTYTRSFSHQKMCCIIPYELVTPGWMSDGGDLLAKSLGL